MYRAVRTTCWPRTADAAMLMVKVPFAVAAAPKLLLATTTLAPPKGSPPWAVTLPVMTAPCCAGSGPAMSARNATTLPISSGPNLGTRMICLLREKGERNLRTPDGGSRAGSGGGHGRAYPMGRDVNDPLGPRPDAPGVTALQTLEVLHHCYSD